MKRKFEDVFFIVVMALAISIVLFGCVSERADLRRLARIEKRNPDIIHQHDSIVTRIDTVRKDSVVKLKGDTIYQSNMVYIPCPDAQLKAVVSHNGGAVVKVVEKHDTLRIKCTCDSLQGVIKILTEKISTTKDLVTQVPRVVPLSPFQNFLMYTGGAFWIILILCIVGLVVYHLSKAKL